MNLSAIRNITTSTSPSLPTPKKTTSQLFKENTMSETPEIRKGLYGVVVDETAVSKVVPETNSLTYRGYPVHELARYCSIEEVGYLRWNGRVPKQESLFRFSAREKALRHFDAHLIHPIMSMPLSCDPMDGLRT